jgi:methylenetetrahydrofolate reductase (NADPH)
MSRDARPDLGTGPARPAVSSVPRATRSVGELLERGSCYSFEFFPPKTDDGERALWHTLRELESLSPAFVSVTYGAGGGERHRTVRVTERIATETTMTPVGHLTCVGSSVPELRQVIGQYAAAGVNNILALRGDPPTGPAASWSAHPQGLVHADQLVALVRNLGAFCVGVAAFPSGHPESADLESDALCLAAKADAGAQFAVTQFFLDSREYFDLVERAGRHGCTIPIVPGIMPVTSYSQVRRFAELAGTPFPPHLASRLQAAEHDAGAVRAIGVEAATQLCQDLLDGGAPGLHFYTLNRSPATRQVYDLLGLGTRVG